MFNYYGNDGNGVLRLTDGHSHVNIMNTINNCELLTSSYFKYIQLLNLFLIQLEEKSRTKYYDYSGLYTLIELF